MSDSAITRASGGDSDESPAGPERILGFLSEDSLKTTQHVRAAREPVRVGNLISISALANVAAARPKLDEVAGSDPETTTFAAEAAEGKRAQLIIAALSIIAVVELGLLVSRWERQQPPATAEPAAGVVAVESTPPGAVITINGENRGITPSVLSLRPGEYAMSLTAGDAVRNVRLVVRAGNSSERFYFSDVDGESLSESQSTLMTESAAQSASRETAGAKHKAPTPTPAALPPTGAVGGWLSVSAPFDLQLFENGVLIGSSQSDRIMLPVGRHVIDAVNTVVGYKTSATVQVSAGAVARLKPEMPNGTVNINAIPWAEVAIDGKPLGPTPLGDVSLPIGPHDVVFTHPQLGERRQNVIVTLNGLNRVSANLNQR